MSDSEPGPGPTVTGAGADPARSAEMDHLVDERVKESFPASDPPAGWAGEDPRDLTPGTTAVRDPAPTGP